MADTITTWIPTSAPTDFQDDAVFNIDFKTKTVQVLVEQPIVAGENLSQFIKFQAPRFYDNIDLTEMSVNILYVSPAGNKGISAAVNTEYSDDMIRCGWLVPYAACPEKGTLLFVLEFVGADYTLKTTIASTPVLDSINDADVIPEPAEQAWYITLQANVSAALQEAQTALGRIESIFNALSTPTAASEASEMLDESTIYVYTGSETGYTYGDWYYYDGEEWVSGGEYASTALYTDQTPTQGSTNAVSSGGVYEALAGKVDAETGKGLSTNDYSDAEKQKVTDASADLSAMTTATAEDVGKALKAKTVADGKVTEWEFGETRDNRVDAIAKQFDGNASLTWEWLQGGWSNLANDPPVNHGTQTTRIRTTISISAKEKITIKCYEGYKYLYSVYKDDIRQDYQASVYQTTDKIFTYGQGTYVIYISLARTDDSAISTEEVAEAMAVLADNAVADVYDAIARTKATAETAKGTAKEMLEKQFPGNPMIYWEWLIGGYSNMANDPPVNHGTSATRTRLCVDVSAQKKITLTCASGYKYTYSIYKDGVRQDYASAWKTDSPKEFAFGEGIYTIYLSLGKSDDTELTTTESESAITLLADNAIADINGTLTQATSLIAKKNLFDRNGANSLRGYYDATNVWTNAGGLGQTDFIPVKQGVQYTSAATSMFVNWYDESKAFISSTPSKTFSAQGYVIPVEGAAFAKFGIIVASQQDFYVYSNEDTPVDIPLDSVPYGLYNQYKGKKGVAFGTSLTYRAKSSGGYLEYLPVMAEMDFDNQGLGNSTILEHTQHTDMMGVITGYNSYADKDVVLIEGFVNDWYDNSDKLGTWKDEGTLESKTVCGRIRYALNYIMSQVPYATIIMLLDPYGQSYNGNDGCASTVVKSGLTQMEYYEEIAKLAMSMGIPTIKGYSISGMNENTPDYYIDIIHPSPLGAKQFADTVWGAMKAIPVKCHS